MGRSDENASLSKLYYRIGEVAQLVGVETHVLRYWETEFPSIRPQKSRSGQRVYSRKDVTKLLRVKELLYAEGFTIAGARQKLRSKDEPRAKEEEPAGPDAAARAASAQKLREVLLGARADVLHALADLEAMAVNVPEVAPPGASSARPVGTGTGSEGVADQSAEVRAAARREGDHQTVRR